MSMTVNELLDYFVQKFGGTDTFILSDHDERLRYKKSFYRVRMDMNKKESK